MKSEGFRIAGFFFAAAALIALVALAGQRILGVAAGPETELITQLKSIESKGLTLNLDGGVLAGTARYQRMSTTVDLQARTAVVFATLDFTGTFAKDTQVSSLGAERIRFSYDGSDWVLRDGAAPTLATIITTLEDRRRAIEAESSDAGWTAETAELLKVSRRQLKIRGWYLRSERETVTVREEFRLLGDLPDRPVDLEATRTLDLVPTSGGFFFADGRL